MLDQLRKYSLYANLNKCQFHQHEVRFLGYIVSHQSIRMGEEQIKTIRDWPEPQSVHDIQVFLGFANFYWQFIQQFSRLAALLTSMLKTASVIGPANENSEQGGQRVRVENRNEKELVQKSCKGQKTAKFKSRSEQKKHRPPELITLAANQDRSSPSKLRRPLPNWGKRLLRLRY